MSVLNDALHAVARAGLGMVARSRLAQVQGKLRLRGLRSPVEVIRDRRGVPHIYASNFHDMYMAQGFVHGQDRLWQMDVSRRIVAGRLSEILGSLTEAVDRWVRILSMRRVAEREVALLDGDERANLEAYAEGVNAAIASGRLPVECALLSYKPEPWTPADSLSWNKMISWELSVNWESEILRAQIISRVGPEKAAELEPDYPEIWPRVLPGDIDYSRIGAQALGLAEASRAFIGPSAHEGLGSNNWVLGGSRTTTGKPLLANDMHLPLMSPAVWYENHMVCEAPGEEMNITGISLPGVPGVIVGHNGHVAWGFTNGFPDVQDLYIEHVRRTGTGRVQYEYKGEWREAEVRQETIKIKGGRPVIQEVITTRHGPIINSLVSGLEDPPLALRWTSLEPDQMVKAILGMNRARTCTEFHEALRHWVAPVQNMVYADTQGNIAYTFAGKVPIRAQGNGMVPVPGWSGEYEWVGSIPFEALPHLYNPPQGYVATANNCVTGKNYPYAINCDYTMGDRAQRIVEMIEGRERIDVPYIARMQFDLLSPSACEVAGHVLAATYDEPDLQAAADLLREWDGRLAAGSGAATLYQVLARRLMSLMLSNKLGELAIRYTGKGPTPVLAERSMFAVRAWAWLLETLRKPDSHWYNLGHGEQRDDVMRLAMRQAVDWLKETLGADPREWEWGKLHTLTFEHLLGQKPPLNKFFNRGPFPIGGDYTTVWSTGASIHDLETTTVVGPPFRFIADLGDLRHSWGLLAPGESGQPGSPHYDDQIQAWFDQGYHPMLYDRQDVQDNAEARLELTP